MADVVGIEITKPLPETGVAGSTYKIEGSVKVFDAVGAPPFVYAMVKRKEWYKPEFAEDASYDRGWPVPISGKFTIEFKPGKEGEYEVTIVATPAPLALPAVGVFPVLAESDVMMVSVGQKPPAVFRFSGVTIDGNKVPLGNHDADSKLLIQKKTTDSLEIIPSFEWVGPSKTATISIKAGYKDWAGNFTPKTDAYTQTLELPESPDTPYSGVGKAITIPLTACGDLSDGAIEIVAKLSDMGDYISRIWNVYVTKPAVVSFRFSAIIIDGKTVSLGNHDVDSGLLLSKTTADSLSVTPAFEWQGSKKSASISIKAGYRDWAGGFTPKTDAYTATFELPDSIDKMYPGQLTSPIKVPLTACGGLADGAIEVVLKISGFSDYISHIWNVYATKAELETLEVKIDPAGAGYVTTSPTPTGGTQHNWQFPKGTTVYVTAHPNSGYVFKSWSGEMTDTTAITAPVYAMTEHRLITAHFEKVVVEEYTLSVSVDPYGGGTVTKSPNKTKYTKGEYVTLTASPASGYDFDRWSGDVSGYSTSISVYMDKNKSVVANFKKKLPDPYTKVTFTVKGDGFPFLTSYWKLYHYGVDGRIWQDYLQHGPGDIITVRDVTSQGKLSCFCCSSVTGEWSEQKYSREFLAEAGEDYKYDIASGIVYYR